MSAGIRLRATGGALVLVALAALGGCRTAARDPAALTPAGLGAVRVGMSVEELEASSGRTFSVEPRALTGCGYAQPLERDAGFAVMLDAGTVVRVDVTGPGIRTVAGIGVGDAEAAVFAAYGGGRVGSAAHEYVPGGHYLSVAPPGAGAAIVFETDGAVVTAIRAGWLPHVTFSEGCE